MLRLHCVFDNITIKVSQLCRYCKVNKGESKYKNNTFFKF